MIVCMVTTNVSQMATLITVITTIIDEMITKGKSDKEILDYIGGLTGLGPKTDAHEPTISVNEEEQSHGVT